MDNAPPYSFLPRGSLRGASAPLYLLFVKGYLRGADAPLFHNLPLIKGKGIKGIGSPYKGSKKVVIKYVLCPLNRLC